MIFNKRRGTDTLLLHNHQSMLIIIDSFDICEKLLEREMSRRIYTLVKHAHTHVK